MLYAFGPCIKRSAPVATRLDSEIINTSNNSEKSLFAPVSSPGISNSPKLYSILFAPADNLDLMI
jgi:hypothetical protein